MARDAAGGEGQGATPEVRGRERRRPHSPWEHLPIWISNEGKEREIREKNRLYNRVGDFKVFMVIGLKFYLPLKFQIAK